MIHMSTSVGLILSFQLRGIKIPVDLPGKSVPTLFSILLPGMGIKANTKFQGPTHKQ
jgi:hypothetical protein